MVSIAYCSEYNKGLDGIPVGVEKDSLAIRTLNISKNMGHTITGLEFENVKQFSTMFLKELAGVVGNNLFLFDAEKAFKELSSSVRYYDGNFTNNFAEVNELFMQMYSTFENSGFDTNSLNDFADMVCVVAGIDKFKMLLGMDFALLFNELFSRIKAMPKVHLIIIDSVDNIKKMEFDPWYKAVCQSTRAIWIGEGMSSQFTIKSTMNTRQLSAKLDNDFGYFIDGSTTVLFKAITEDGEEAEYESL